MITGRWRKAIQAEKKFASKFKYKAIEWAKDYPSYIKDNFSVNCSPLEPPILEIGCGPYGFIYSCKEAFCVGIDPIRYKQEWSSGTCDHIVAIGEALPFEEKSFATVMCSNVLDHVADPKAVTLQIARVLRPRGHLILWVHIFPRTTCKLLNFLSPLIDKPHPHHLSKESIFQLITTTGLKLIIIKICKKKEFEYNIKARIAKHILLDLFIICQK
jgi:ubiquinone/menaquinone biosynthesis C-methylase UbiE